MHIFNISVKLSNYMYRINEGIIGIMWINKINLPFCKDSSVSWDHDVLCPLSGGMPTK